jgi:hypothetical protein
MINTTRNAKSSFLLALIAIACGCVVVPEDGHYDRDHHRYYHDHAWHDCVDHDEHCG